MVDDWFGMDPPKKPIAAKPVPDKKPVAPLQSPEGRRTSTSMARKNSRRSLRIDLVNDDGGPSDSTGLNIPT